MYVLTQACIAGIMYACFAYRSTAASAGGGSRHLCYVVFDLLYYVDMDGEIWDLTRAPLRSRKELLNRVIKPVVHRLEVAPHQVRPFRALMFTFFIYTHACRR
jgi:hypothetical protein